LEVVKFWNQFRVLLEHNDTAAIARLSLETVFCPVYRNDWNYFTDNKAISLFFFLHAPFRNYYISKFSAYFNKDTPKIRIIRSAGNEITTYVSYPTTEHYRNYEIFRTHTFEFVAIKGSLKFAGLTVAENGTWTERKVTNTDSLYFPLAPEKWDAITNPESLDTFTNMWYSGTLAGFIESILYNYRSKDEIYRFTWLRSFNNPIVIKFEHHNNDFILTTKELVDYQGYRADEIIRNEVTTLPPFQWMVLEAKIEKINFWNMQSRDPEPRPFDGAEWILEANIKGKYHFTTRYSGEKDYKACCLYLLSLSNLRIPERNIY